MYGTRNLEMSIRFSIKSRPSERFHRPEMFQIKTEISLCTNMKLIFHKNGRLKWYQWIPNLNYFAQILCYKNREFIDIILLILHFYEKSTSR